MAARCLLLVWVKSAKGIPQPRANVFQERGRCWGILPSGGAVLGIVPGHGGHRHRQDLRQPVLDGGDDLEEMKSGLSSQKGITMLRQHRTIPALRLKHRSGSCGTASALPKCSIMSGCGTRIVLRGKSPSHSATASPASVRCFRHWRRSSLQHPVLSALLAWHLPHLARRIGT